MVGKLVIRNGNAFWTCIVCAISGSGQLIGFCSDKGGQMVAVTGCLISLKRFKALFLMFFLDKKKQHVI